jgi:hypothetical protein
LGIVSTLIVTVALLLLAYPGANYLYSEVKWTDAIEHLSAPFSTAEALPASERLDDGEQSDTGYWVENSVEDIEENHSCSKFDYVPTKNAPASYLESEEPFIL